MLKWLMSWRYIKFWFFFWKFVFQVRIMTIIFQLLRWLITFDLVSFIKHPLLEWRNGYIPYHVLPVFFLCFSLHRSDGLSLFVLNLTDCYSIVPMLCCSHLSVSVECSQTCLTRIILTVPVHSRYFSGCRWYTRPFSIE